MEWSETLAQECVREEKSRAGDSGCVSFPGNAKSRALAEGGEEE